MKKIKESSIKYGFLGKMIRRASILMRKNTEMKRMSEKTQKTGSKKYQGVY